MPRATDHRSATLAALALIVASALALPRCLPAQQRPDGLLFAIPNGVRIQCSPELVEQGYGAGVTRHFFWIGNLLAPDREVYLDVDAKGEPLYYFDWSTQLDSTGATYVSGGLVTFATDSTPAEGFYARTLASEFVKLSARDSTVRDAFVRKAVRRLTEDEIHLARQVAAFFSRVRCQSSPPRGDASRRRTSL